MVVEYMPTMPYYKLDVSILVPKVHLDPITFIATDHQFIMCILE